MQYCLSRGTWSTYKTAWKQFTSFARAQGYVFDLPVPLPILCRFVIYLYKRKQLMHGTIKNYVSGIKFIHGMANVSTEVFKSFWFVKLMTAIRNLCWAQLRELPPNRCAFTYPALKVFGHQLYQNRSMHPWLKLNIWTAALLAFYASLRLGDFLPNSHGIDQIRVISWDRLRIVDEDQISFLILLPKNTTKNQGVVRDIVRTKDPRFCPVHNILKLYDAARQDPNFSETGPIFTKPKGGYLHTYDINKAIEVTMEPLFGKVFSGHSFRSALPSEASENPADFSNEVVMSLGDWHNLEVVELYKRRKGVGVKSTMKKLENLRC